MTKMTYAEAIEVLRAEREKVSETIEELRKRRELLTVQINSLEETVRVPKRGKALPGDVVMTVEPAMAQVKIVVPPKE